MIIAFGKSAILNQHLRGISLKANPPVFPDLRTFGRSFTSNQRIREIVSSVLHLLYTHIPTAREFNIASPLSDGPSVILESSVFRKAV